MSGRLMAVTGRAILAAASWSFSRFLYLCRRHFIVYLIVVSNRGHNVHPDPGCNSALTILIWSSLLALIAGLNFQIGSFAIFTIEQTH